MVYRKLFTTEERPRRSKNCIYNLEVETIKEFSKLSSIRSKILFPTTKNTKNLFFRW